MRNELRDVDEERGENSNHDNSTETTAGQGRYVVPFTMSREEEAAGMELARSELARLMAECAAEEKTDEESSSGWTRSKSKKKMTDVLLWEKGSVKAKRDKKKNWSSTSSASAEADPNATEDGKPVMYSVRSSTTVNAPLDTMLKTLDASVATAHRSFTRIIYGNLVADASVLFHSSTVGTDFLADSGNDSYETFAVRWLVCRCSNPMVSDCDFCLQEYTKRHSIDELTMNGNQYSNNKHHERRSFGYSRGGLHALDEMPAAYKLFRSMETKHCPELLESHRVVRSKVPLGGFLLYPTDSSDKTDVVFYMSIAQDKGDNRSDNASLSTPMLTQCSDRQFRALQNVVRQMALQIDRLDNAVDSYKMSLHLESLRTRQWVRNAERVECAVCCRRFNQLTRRRHHCRLCGEVICRECSIHKDVDLPTFGPTVLRICTSCDRTHTSSEPKKVSYMPSRSEPEVSSSPEKIRKRRTPTAAVHRVEKSKQTSVAVAGASVSELPVRRRSSTLGGDNVKTMVNERQTREKSEQRFVTALEGVQRRIALEQAASCPKPASTPVIERRYFANKWAGTRLMPKMNSPVVTTAPNTPKKTAIPSPFGLGRSSSETFSFSPSYQQPKLHTHFPAYQSNDSEDEDKFDEPQDRNHQPYSTRSVYAVKNGILADNDSSNQPTTSINGGQQDRPLVYRSFETLQLYEDILLKLCENSASVRNSKFVALTLFARTSQAGKNQNEAEAGETAIYYLKVQGSAKLMKVAANMRCCDPVLELHKPVATRNTWALDGKSPVHPSGFNFRKLPIVLGPQQARFYAGVPLTDSTKRYRYGAIAVFDAAINPGEDNDLPMKKTLQALQVCAQEAVLAVDERRQEVELRTFLQAPLVQLRQSEPAMHLSMEISQSSPQWRDLVEQESLDGDSDCDDQDQQQLEYELRNARAKSDPESSHSGSSNKNRVQYFHNEMQKLVQQAQDTQAQMVENSLVMERHGVII